MVPLVSTSEAPVATRIRMFCTALPAALRRGPCTWRCCLVTTITVVTMITIISGWLLLLVEFPYESPIRTASQNKTGLRVISYSLYGTNHARYTAGAVENVDLAPLVYPNWTVRVYHDNTVPDVILEYLQKRDVQLVNMSGSLIKNGMSWRFLVASDPTVERFIVRDIDSRLSLRELAAVNEWIVSGKRFHIMRDHPSHTDWPIGGGMWGGTDKAVPDMKERMEKVIIQTMYLGDMEFLDRQIWPLARVSVLQHDSFSCEKYSGSVPFPTPRLDVEYVGSVYNGGKLLGTDTLKRAKPPTKCTPHSIIDSLPH